jgi:hypothetical protein
MRAILLAMAMATSFACSANDLVNHSECSSGRAWRSRSCGDRVAAEELKRFNEPRHEAENKLPNGSDARGRERMTAPIL